MVLSLPNDSYVHSAEQCWDFMVAVIFYGRSVELLMFGLLTASKDFH
jgi:hypothetical protein